MSAKELIQQIAALSEQERMLFEQLFSSMKTTIQVPGSAARTNWPDFGERLRTIYGDKIAPDSQQIIDEGRGGR